MTAGRATGRGAVAGATAEPGGGPTGATTAGCLTVAEEAPAAGLFEPAGAR